MPADLDGDGDLDVLSASPGDDKIAWYENTDGTRDLRRRSSVIADQDDYGRLPGSSTRVTWTATATWMCSRRPSPRDDSRRDRLVREHRRTRQRSGWSG